VGKTMTNKSDKTQLEQFKKLILANFSEFLKQHDFQYVKERTEQYFYEIIYTKKKLYIKFEININPQDYPPYFNILLGDGSIDWPDVDWNCIALWRYIEQSGKKNEMQKYSLEDLSKLEENLKKAKEDLIKYAKNFLNGDLLSFYRIRKDVNKNRKPYKIYIRNKDGSYSEKYDEESIRLKEKYS
jgi:hypothetical protein